MTDLKDRWLSVKEICTYLGESNNTVYRWIKSHRLPSHRVGRLSKFQRIVLDEWVKAGGASQKETTALRAKAKGRWHIPDYLVLEGDPKLLMLHDQTIMRTEGD